MSVVSECCNKEIIVCRGREFPLGGSTWGQSYKYDACAGCGMETTPVDACEECGVVGCLGGECA